MGRYDYEKTKLEHLGNLKDVKIISATLPRHSIQLQNETFSKTLSMKKAKDIALTLPPNSAQRPTTLPYRSSLSISSASPTTKSPEIDLNPLRILRDKNYPIVRSRIKVCAAPHDDEIDRSISQDVDGACESPSYLTNAEYTFSEKDVNIHRGIQKQIATKEIENLNPIPLPPRDRSKVMQTNVKRHIRKHPLIIPASGLQRTLNKVTSPTDTKSTGFTATSDLIKHTNQSILFAHPEKCVSVPKLKNFDHPYMNQEDVNVSRNKNHFFTKHFLEQNFPDTGDRTYENLETLRYQMQDCTDSASLHFESILEDDMNKIGEMSSPDVANGFMFQIQKDHYEKPNVSQLDGETDEIRNLDIERRKMEFSQKHPKYLQPNNELANNVLFNKVKESVESVFRADDSLNRIRPASTVSRSREEFSNINDKPNENDELLEQKLKNSNSVSCEDLLEFSDSKPKGRERGVESDEVRIMTKVLGTVASPEQCIEALNFIDWDVHKAIKLIMLRKTLSSCNLTLEECVDALQKYEWDLQTTTLKLKTL